MMLQFQTLTNGISMKEGGGGGTLQEIYAQINAG